MRLFTGVMVLVLACLSLNAQAQEWEPVLLADSSGAYGPQSPVQIQLPSSVRQDQLQWLALELDDTDVSQVVSLSQNETGSVISITPPQALAAGPHVLRLVEYSERGDIIERGYWTFQVEPGTGFSDSSIAASTTVELGYRIAEDDVSNAPKATSVQGSTSIDAKMATGKWQISARANFLYGTVNQPAAPSGEEGAEQGESEAVSSGVVAINRHDVELGEYLLEARSESMQAMLGHHAMSDESLIMRGFNRRGASFTGQAMDGHVAASGFAFRTDPIAGWFNGLGVSDNENRVIGGLVTMHPFSGSKQALILTGSCLTGEGRDAIGVSLDGDASSARGDACSLVAESRLSGGSVKLRGEYAGSNFDFDGQQELFNKESDDAFDLLAVYSPLGEANPGGKRLVWDIGAEVQQIGLFFRSLANPTLPSDKQLTRAFTNLQYGGLTLQLQGGVEEDNVDDDKQLPTMRNNLGNLNLTYTPELVTDEQGMPVLKWYGLPTLSFASQYAKQKHISLPSDLEDYRVSQRTYFNQLSAMFQYQTWSWLLGYGLGEETDQAGQTFDRQNQLTNLALNWQFAERLSLATQGQYNVIDDEVTDVKTKSKQASVNLNTVLIRDKLTLGLGASLGQNDASDNTIDQETRTYDFNLDWQFIQAKNNRPGLGFSLRGERQEIRDELFPENDSSPYQVFVGARIAWPVAYPKAY